MASRQRVAGRTREAVAGLDSLGHAADDAPPRAPPGRSPRRQPARGLWPAARATSAWPRPARRRRCSPRAATDSAGGAHRGDVLDRGTAARSANSWGRAWQKAVTRLPSPSTRVSRGRRRPSPVQLQSGGGRVRGRARCGPAAHRTTGIEAIGQEPRRERRGRRLRTRGAPTPGNRRWPARAPNRFLAGDLLGLPRGAVRFVGSQRSAPRRPTAPPPRPNDRAVLAVEADDLVGEHHARAVGSTP